LADGGSRLKSQGSDQNICNDTITFFSLDESALAVFTKKEIPQAIALDEIYNAQQEDDNCQTLIRDVLKEDSKFCIGRADGKPLL
jgi:hypothetical protein